MSISMKTSCSRNSDKSFNSLNKRKSNYFDPFSTERLRKDRFNKAENPPKHYKTTKCNNVTKKNRKSKSLNLLISFPLIFSEGKLENNYNNECSNVPTNKKSQITSKERLMPFLKPERKIKKLKISECFYEGFDQTEEEEYIEIEDDSDDEEEEIYDGLFITESDLDTDDLQEIKSEISQLSPKIKFVDELELDYSSNDDNSFSDEVFYSYVSDEQNYSEYYPRTAEDIGIWLC